jgi:AhpD family alkylhydroperoxidase
MMRVMAHSPALLGGYLQLSEALMRGTLPAGLRESIAVLIAEQNGCDCLSAHSYLAEHVAKLSAEQIARARHAHSEDAHIRAALQFAAAVHGARGRVSPEQLEAARSAGLNNAELMEIIGHVGLNVLTNYFNLAAGTEVDFPLVVPGRNAA